MENFDIYAFGIETHIKNKLADIGLKITEQDRLPYFQKDAIIFLAPPEFDDVIEKLNETILNRYIIVIGVPEIEHASISFVLRENFTNTEFLIALNCGKKALLKQVQSTFISEKNKLITEELSGNIHDIFSYLNNISARIQFLEMVVKDNSHVNNAVELTIDQTRKMTKILRNLQIFSKSNLNPDDKANIKVQDLFINIYTMFSNKLMKRKMAMNIDSLTELEYFTGCNIDILFLFIASTVKLIVQICDETTIYVNSEYKPDQLLVLFRFKKDHKNISTITTNDFYNEKILPKKLYQKLMNSSKATLEIENEANDINILLHFPKGV